MKRHLVEYQRKNIAYKKQKMIIEGLVSVLTEYQVRCMLFKDFGMDSLDMSSIAVRNRLVKECLKILNR